MPSDTGTPPKSGTLEADALWRRYCEYRVVDRGLGMALDVSRVRFDDGYLQRSGPALTRALDAMAALETGAVANCDEDRMVGHYWLRAPELAPSPGITREIRAEVDAVAAFARRVHDGTVRGAAGPFRHLIHVGIGGSALGSRLVCDALSAAHDRIAVHFLDNNDPDGVERLLARLDGALGRTLVSVVSKSGITPTPDQLRIELELAYRRAGLDFPGHAIATTTAGSPLDERAVGERWLGRLRLWDWVGGRTSVTSAVGLLPLALQGTPPASLLDGAAAMDRLTRRRSPADNPAALLAAMWRWHKGRSMVILPYSERLALLARYLQQLVMESIGKTVTRAGATVHEGLTVYGGKGATDQHAYGQQLHDGPADFFATLIGVDVASRPEPVEVAPGLTLGDFLFGSMEATRDTLFRRGRDSITLRLADVSARSLGALIALFERAVGIYAELVDVNAYHQPAVDKFAAAPVVALQLDVLSSLRELEGPCTAEELAAAIGRPEAIEAAHRILTRLAADPRGAVGIVGEAGDCSARFFWAHA